MLRSSRTLVAALVLSTSVVAGAVAQGTPGGAAPVGGQFVSSQATGEYRATKFSGVDIYGSDNEKIGDVSEVLLDGQGSAKAVVIGVGGFLGIGQKNVAVPWAAVTWSNDQPPVKAASPAATPPATGATNPSTGGGASGSPTPPTATRKTPEEQAAANGYPNYGKVSLSKADLQNAPDFRYAGETSGNSGAAAPAPRQ